jgi:hypothetical protein
MSTEHRQAATYTIPISLGWSAHLSAPFPLSETEWEQLHSVLEAMRPALIQEPAPTTQAAPEEVSL